MLADLAPEENPYLRANPLRIQVNEQDSIHDEVNMINKERWVEIMRAAGLKEQDMSNWHRQFEKMEPEAHQEFLESLGIEQSEIKRIREHSRKPA